MTKRDLVLSEVASGKTSDAISLEHGIPIATIRYYRERSKSGPQQLECVAEYRRRMKRKTLAYSGGRCLKCDYGACDAAMSFHHLDPKAKESTLSSGVIKSWKKYKVELDKTILLCCRCHSELHAGLWCPTGAMELEQFTIRVGYVDRPLPYYKAC